MNIVPLRLPAGRHRPLWLSLALLLLLAAAVAPPVLAHSRVIIGPYAVVVGWANEPPIVGERNALVFEFSDEASGEPVSGVEATLDAEVQYGGRTFRTNLNPSETPGLYTADIYPTVRGQYGVRLFGSIGDQTVDQILEPEEILPASQLQFPEAQPDTLQVQSELQAEIANLNGQLQTTRLLGLAGLGLGALALVLALIVLLRRR